jgi:hypothetical protein
MNPSIKTNSASDFYDPTWRKSVVLADLANVLPAILPETEKYFREHNIGGSDNGSRRDYMVARWCKLTGASMPEVTKLHSARPVDIGFDLPPWGE